MFTNSTTPATWKSRLCEGMSSWLLSNMETCVRSTNSSWRSLFFVKGLPRRRSHAQPASLAQPLGTGATGAGRDSEPLIARSTSPRHCGRLPTRTCWACTSAMDVFLPVRVESGNFVSHSTRSIPASWPSAYGPWRRFLEEGHTFNEDAMTEQSMSRSTGSTGPVSSHNTVPAGSTSGRSSLQTGSGES